MRGSSRLPRILLGLLLLAAASFLAGVFPKPSYAGTVPGSVAQTSGVPQSDVSRPSRPHPECGQDARATEWRAFQCCNHGNCSNEGFEDASLPFREGAASTPQQAAGGSSPPAAQNSTESDPLLFGDSFAKGQPAPSDKLRIVSYNLHGPPTGRIQRMYDLFSEDQLFQRADVIALQEANRDHRGSGNRDVARELAVQMGMDYVYAVELDHDKGGGQRGLSILSRLPLQQPRRLVLPVEGPGGRRRIALSAGIPLGDGLLRLYNTHLETRISVENRGRQIQAIIDDAGELDSSPVLILGDFNTFSPGARRKMFELMEGAGYTSPLPGDQTTFQYKFFLRLTLDWIWVKNLAVLDAGVEGKVKASDHRPLWVTITTPN